MGRGMAARRWPAFAAALMAMAACGSAHGSGGTPPPIQAGTSSAVATGAGPRWVEVPVAGGPLARNSGGFAYDPGSGRMLLSGGRHGCGPSATSYVDTWTFDGSAWQQQHPRNDGPGEMSRFTMAYDQGSRQVVALGVFSGCGVSTGMFSWSGTDWVAAPQSVALPDPSFSYTLTYDDARHRLLAVGATRPVNAPGKDTEQTWAWDGRAWMRLHPAHSPPPLADAAAAYDPASRRVILFGGTTLNDDGSRGAAVASTWAWDGSTWTHLHPATSPSARLGAALVTDSALGQPVLFGGIDRSADASGATVLADTWAWVAGTWAQQHPAAAPPPRFDAQMAYDPGREQIVLFGGALNGSTDSDDVWVYRSH